jgi:primosomal protein N' (replication factor Y)
MDAPQKILKVALNVPLNQLFDYLLNDSNCVVGQYVTVPFGNRKMVGVICAIESKSSLPFLKLKRILSVDSEMLFDTSMFKLLNFVSNYYHFPIGQTIMSVVPNRIKKNMNKVREKERIYQATTNLTKESIDRLPLRQVRLRKVAKAILIKDIRQSELFSLVANWTVCIRKLEDLKYVSSVVYDPKENIKLEKPHNLNEEQKIVIKEILKTKSFVTWLIHGITGSGKTEIYMQLIKHFLISENDQVLVLVPEINLTPQLENRFRNRFPSKKLVSLHSQLSDIERLDHWRQAKSGEAKIIIGTRLAVFTPILKLKLIIIDEEHDSSFKQQDGLRYHARDVALMRAKNHNIPVIMGTATPALETWFNATHSNAKYKYLKLKNRAVPKAQLPDIKLIQVDDKTKKSISKHMIESIQSRLNRNEQTLIFINRRGYAPVLVCSSCGWTADCHRCSSRLVVHSTNKRLKCHHCGHDHPIPMQCEDCGNIDLFPLGTGTQKVEEILNSHFPRANILRVDRDTTKSKKALTNLYHKMNNREIDILVGTQMLAKGHDFPYLTLVGVLDIDSALYSCDFRASEKLFSQLIQVSGRAGRAEIRGEVLIQTNFPNHKIFSAIQENDYDLFAQTLLNERKQMKLPPFSFSALIHVESKSLDFTMKFTNDISKWAKESLTKVDIFGPVRPVIERLKGYERAQLFLQASTRKDLQNMLRPWVTQIKKHPLSNRVKWSIDVDPIEF